MKNLKLKNFEKEVSEKLTRELELLDNVKKSFISNLDACVFEKFSNHNPYKGDFRNKIFLTYSDVYYSNSPLYMSIGKLHHPHKDIDDRGYIKGVAIDLSTYLVLREIKSLEYTRHLYNAPKFRKSKHQQTYLEEIAIIVATFQNTLNDKLEEIKREINNLLKSKTDCSLLYYIKKAI